MKPQVRLTFLSTVFLIAVSSAYFSGVETVQGGDKERSVVGMIRPCKLDSHTESPQGYLKVYSATDEFNDGDEWYLPHSSYAIYTIDGKLFKNVENHISRSDEIPEVVALPVGSYMVVAPSDKDGYIRLPVVIKAGQRTILDLDLRGKGTLNRLAHN